MPNTFLLFLKSLVISLMCCAVFVGVGYYYIDANLTPAEQKIEYEPYSQENPENAGVLFEISGDSTFFYLDFDLEKLMVSLKPAEITENEIYGYSVDYKIEGDLSIITKIVDYIGGAELNIDGDVLRYTGSQIAEIIKTNNQTEFKRELIEEIANTISLNGISLDFFTNIIENSDTDLTLPDCYFWADNFNNLCANLQIID